LQALLWIRIGLNADQDPAFYLSVDPDLDPQSDFEDTKIRFLHEVNRSTNMPTEVKKGLFEKFYFYTPGSGSELPICIQNSQMNADP
jgi:hypothetical protein